MGTLQALEAIKLAAGVGQVLSQRLLIFDALALRFQTVKLRGRWALSSLPLSSILLGWAMQVCETHSQAARHVSPAALCIHLATHGVAAMFKPCASFWAVHGACLPVPAKSDGIAAL